MPVCVLIPINVFVFQFEQASGQWGFEIFQTVYSISMCTLLGRISKINVANFGISERADAQGTRNALIG